jgi:hypothetical protein
MKLHLSDTRFAGVQKTGILKKIVLYLTSACGCAVNMLESLNPKSSILRNTLYSFEGA